MHILVPGAVHLYGKRQNKTFYLDIDLPSVLVAELSAHQAGIAVQPVFAHLLLEALDACGQRVPEFFPKGGNHTRHHAPIIFLAHQAVSRLGILIKPYAGVEHRGVRDILLCPLVRKLHSAFLWIKEIFGGSFIYRIVPFYPFPYPGLWPSEDFLNFLPIRFRKTVNGYHGAVAKPFSLT